MRANRVLLLSDGGVRKACEVIFLEKLYLLFRAILGGVALRIKKLQGLLWHLEVSRYLRVGGGILPFGLDCVHVRRR